MFKLFMNLAIVLMLAFLGYSYAKKDGLFSRGLHTDETSGASGDTSKDTKSKDGESVVSDSASTADKPADSVGNDTSKNPNESGVPAGDAAPKTDFGVTDKPVKSDDTNNNLQPKMNLSFTDKSVGSVSAISMESNGAAPSMVMQQRADMGVTKPAESNNTSSMQPKTDVGIAKPMESGGATSAAVPPKTDTGVTQPVESGSVSTRAMPSQEDMDMVKMMDSSRALVDKDNAVAPKADKGVTNGSTGSSPETKPSAGGVGGSVSESSSSAGVMPSVPLVMAEHEIGGDFILKDQTGESVDSTKLRGKHLLVTFGFAGCKTTCPVVLSMMSSVMDRLGQDADKVVPIFINIDPEQHDSMASIKEHNLSFDNRIRILSGGENEIKEIEAKYGVYAGQKGADGQIDHSSYVYLMDQNGHYVTHFSPSIDGSPQSDDVESILKAVKIHVSGGN